MKNTLFVLSALLIASVFASTYNCEWDAVNTGENPFTAHYNLVPLRTDSQWSVKDTEISATRNFTYVFNVCSSVKTIPRAAGNGTACRRYTDATTGLPLALNAYQVSNLYDQCYSLSDDKEGSWSLLDSTDPSYGVAYTYQNGDDYGCGGVKRTLEIDLYCHDNSYNVPTYNRVDEQKGCFYVMEMLSIYGCPTECGVADRQLCGGNGLCKLDKDAQAPHCYCYDGYWGSACANTGDEKPEGFTTTTWALVVVFVFLLLAELAIVCMWKRISSLRLDPAAYKSMIVTDDVAV